MIQAGKVTLSESPAVCDQAKINLSFLQVFRGVKMKNALSILKANRLYLLTMLLIIIIGSFIQFYSLGWGLIGTEILLIFLRHTSI